MVFGGNDCDGAVVARSLNTVSYTHLTSLTTVPVDLFDSCKGVTDFSNTFGKCSNPVSYTHLRGRDILSGREIKDLHTAFTIPAKTAMVIELE